MLLALFITWSCSPKTELVFFLECLLGSNAVWTCTELKMEAVCSSETFLSTYKSTRRYYPEQHFYPVRTSNLRLPFLCRTTDKVCALDEKRHVLTVKLLEVLITGIASQIWTRKWTVDKTVSCKCSTMNLLFFFFGEEVHISEETWKELEQVQSLTELGFLDKDDVSLTQSTQCKRIYRDRRTCSGWRVLTVFVSPIN
jgi:hypothetical protein